MRIHTGLLVLPLFVGFPSHGVRVTTANSAPHLAADSMTVSVRWNRLVPRFVEEAAAARRAARAAATAAGDSAALRRIAQSQPPMLMRVYTLLSVAQYGAGNAARASRATSPEIAAASASATVLVELFTDSTVRASIARELARDLERAAVARVAVRTASAALGGDVARRVIARGPTLEFTAP